MLRQKLSRNCKSIDNDDTPENPVSKKVKLDPKPSSSSTSDSISQGDTSKYFSNSTGPESSIVNSMIQIQKDLCDTLRSLTFRAPVEYVYNPLEYAYKCNEDYIRKYCKNSKTILFVGMNPGPFGMCQTGVPFGEIASVRDWLGIQNEVLKPDVECPERPVLGFDCTRSEVSGNRLWNFFKSICGTPEKLFESSFVYNYCPLAFLNSKGVNITPSELKNARELEDICDRTYLEIIKLLNPEIIVSIGRYVEKRTKETLKNSTLDTKVLCMTHPSPRVPRNQNWPDKAKQFLIDNNLMKFYS